METELKTEVKIEVKTETKTKEEFSFWECSCGAQWLEGLNLVYCGTCGSPRFRRVHFMSPFLISARYALMEASHARTSFDSGCSLTREEALVLLQELQRLEKR